MSSQGEAKTVAIIGAGQAGFQCAASLRENGWDGPLFLIGKEPEPPYYRPPLSKDYLRGETSDDDIRFRPDSFFSRNGIDVIQGDEACAIDRAARQVQLASGKRISYDHLVLATGAAPRVPDLEGITLRGVIALHDRHDARVLRDLLPRCESLVIVGGGFIGTEVAASAAAMCAVTILESAPRILMRSLSAIVAQRAREAHQSHGVQVLENCAVSALRGDRGRVRSVLLANGDSLDADLVLFATGVTPRSALAANAGLKVANGVLVNETLQTSDRRISAIGDCANFPTRFSPDRTRLESVQNAADQARHVAERIATAVARPYDAVPWFWTYQYSDKVQIAGIASDKDGCVMVPGETPGSFSVYRVRHGAAVAVESVNAPRDHIRARKSLAAGPVQLAELEGRDGIKAAVDDPAIPSRVRG